MTVKTQWLVEHRVLISSFEGLNDEDDVQLMVNDVKKCLAEATGPVYFLADLSEIEAPEGKPNVDMARLISLVKTFKDPRIALILSYGYNGNLVYKFLAHTLPQLVGFNAWFANDHEDALRIVAEHDPALLQSRLIDDEIRAGA